MKERTTGGSPSDYSHEPSPAYEKLKQQEAIPPDPNEIIVLPCLVSGSPEIAHLQSAGISLSELREGKVTRERLLNAGYVFINKIGGGEKPIISVQIAVPGGEDIDFSRRTLLTHEEFAVVLDYQGQYTEQFSTGGQDINVVR